MSNKEIYWRRCRVPFVGQGTPRSRAIQWVTIWQQSQRRHPGGPEIRGNSKLL